MVKLTTKRRRAPDTPKEDVIPESIFDALGAHSPGGPQAQDGGSQPKAKADTQDGPTVADLMKQLEAMNSRLEQSERASLALATPTPQVPSLAPEPKMNFDGMPDPVIDPKGYGEHLAARMTKYNSEMVDYNAKRNAPAQNQGQNLDTLWEDFNERFPAYAEDQDRIEYATQQAVKQAERRGLDVRKYMQTMPDRFFNDITKAFDKTFGRPDEGEFEDEPRAAAPPRRQRAPRREPDEDDEPTRTGGIFGGHDPSGGRAPKAPPAGDMITDLQNIQRKMGYY